MKFALLLTVFLASPALAWDDCPFGLVDDPSPGRCRLYVDTNQDGLCDRSQKKPVPAEDKPDSSPEVKTILVSDNKNQSPPVARPSSGRPSQVTVKPDSGQTTALPVTETPAPKTHPLQARSGRHVLAVLMITSLLALATEWLIYAKKSLAFRLQSIWNWLLLAFFLLSSATGIYFILVPIQADPPLALRLYFWHVDTGLVFVAIGVYHALRRMPCMLRGLSSCFRRV